MTPSLKQRWKCLGLGLGVIISLAFLWAVSMDSLRGVAVRSASGWTFAGQFEGEIGLAGHVDIRPWASGKRFALIDEYGTGGSPEYGVWWKENIRPGWILRHGHLALLIVGSWVAWLASRWWRVRGSPPRFPPP